jgi:hypothetical protein
MVMGLFFVMSNAHPQKLERCAEKIPIVATLKVEDEVEVKKYRIFSLNLNLNLGLSLNELDAMRLALCALRFSVYIPTNFCFLNSILLRALI